MKRFMRVSGWILCVCATLESLVLWLSSFNVIPKPHISQWALAVCFAALAVTCAPNAKGHL